MTSIKGPLRFWNSRRRNDEPSEVTSVARKATSTPKQEEELVQLNALNAAITSLAAIFPDVQLEVFREMLGTFPEESRLHVVTESLLRHKAKWVRGRWRVPDTTPDATIPARQSLTSARDDNRDGFRSTHYKETVKSILYDEFKGLSRSAIKAVLAEHNYSYLHARPVLLKLALKSWRYFTANLLTRRRAPDSEQCPLIIWRGTDPFLLPTPCNELNEEVELYLIAPTRAKKVLAQITADEEFANQLNDGHAMEADASYDCECCFSTCSFERIATCASGDHFMCFTCIHHTMSEVLYGQGWAKSVDADRSTLKCIAAGSGDECTSPIPSFSVQRALEVISPQESVWEKFEERVAREVLNQCRIPMNKCPFCSYAEAIEAPPAPLRPLIRFDERPLIVLLAMCGILFMSLIPIFGVPASILAAYYLSKRIRNNRPGSSQNTNPKDPNYGHKFICRAKNCKRISCLRCSIPWIDVHVCHQSSRQALRTYIESAVTDSIKRTCPKCNLSFVKSSGCNKLVCVCGYSMCYVCRQDVGKEGYSHFCPHFRANPDDSCRECTRCDLYRTEDDDEVMAKAKDKAVAEWKEQIQGKEGAEEMLKSLQEDLKETVARPRSGGSESWFAAFRR